MHREATALLQPSVSQEREMIEEFKERVGSQTYKHWFEDKASIEITDQQVTIGVDNPFLLSWMQHRFRPAVTAAARSVLGESAEVRFKTRPSPDIVSCGGTAAPKCEAAAPDAPVSQTERRPAESRGSVRMAGHGTHARPAPGASATGGGPAPGRRFADLADFVKGPGNELALTAALQICDQPGARYNPLVLYGGVGTGKTHLLEAVYRRIRARHASLNVLFLSAEGFANYFTQALRDRSLPSFRQRFRTVDALFVDDVDFLDGKRVIQEEFLHTIRQIESHQRQIVLSADRHPRLLAGLSEELVTRFIAGIVCRMEAPDLDTRRQIVARKAARLTARVSDEALDFVAQRFGTSVRELEGALNCLETYGLMTGKPVGLSAARHVLADLERDCVRVVRLADVEQAVCRFFAVGVQDLRSPRRSRSVSQPRMLAMYLARKMTQAAYSEIGEYFGGRNHSTVISAEKRVREQLSSETTIRVASQSWKLADLLSSLEQQLLTG